MDPNDQMRREDCQRMIDDLMKNAILKNNASGIRKNENFGCTFSSLLDNLRKASKNLKWANKELKKKAILRRRLLTNCELMISYMVSNLSDTYKILEKSKKVEEADKMAVANLKSRVVELECRLSQFRGLKLKKDDILVNKLRKEVYKMASIKRMEKISSNYLSQLNEKNAEIKKWEHRNKAVMPLLNEFGTRLAEASLLTENFKKNVIKKYGKEYLSETQECSGACRSQTVEKNIQLKKLLFQNNKIMNFLKEFGNEILQAGLLNPTFSLEIYARYRKDGFTGGPSRNNAQSQD